MKKYVIVLEYDIKEMMDLRKIEIFLRNLKKVEEKGNKVNFVIYGKNSIEELAVCMTYLNKLLQNNLCEVAISTKTKEFVLVIKDNIVLEGGANHQSKKLSEKNIKDLKSKNFKSILKEKYKDAEIKMWPTRNWENTILELIEE